MSIRSKKIVNLIWFVKNPKLTRLILLTILIAVIFLLANQRYHIVKENRQKDINAILENVELRLNSLLKRSQSATLTLALTLDQNGKPQNFEEVAAEVIAYNPYLKTVQLVPNGVVTYTYPISGNEKAVGLDLFKDGGKNALEAQKAVKSRKMYFQGPVSLIQGDVGVIGRMPLFIGKKFWGFSAVVIRLDELLKIAGIDNSHRYYRFKFSKIDVVTGQEEFFVDDKDFKNDFYRMKVFEDGDWNIYLSDIRSPYADYQLISLVVLGLLISILLSYLLIRLLRRQAQLLSLVDTKSTQLNVTESKYKTIFDNAAIGIGKVDSVAGEFLEVNKFLCNLLGYSAEELTRKKIKTLIHEEDLEADSKSFKRLLANEIRQFSSVRRYIHKSGKVIWGNAIVNSLWEKGAAPDYHIIIIDDITQQVSYEKELVASQKHIEDLINSIEGIVWEVSIKDGFSSKFISSKVYDILGYTPEEWIEEPHINKIYEEDRPLLEAYLSTELYKRKQHVYEYRVLAKDGSIVWVRDIVNVEPNLERPEMLRGIMIDITSIKNAEEALRSSFELVNEQNKRLLNFSYIVSHNLRSHASNIDGITLLISNAETDQEREEMLELLKKVVKNLNDTLYNLNDIVSIQSNINIDKEPLNLDYYLARAVLTQEEQILRKNADIINKVDPDIYVNFNKAYLESVLLNLIANALRYSHPERRPKIIITCEKEQDAWILSISDNGVGIDLMKNGSKIFGLNQTFYGNSDARGFGLFITKNQIEAMGGDIEVESKLGVGTTFRVFFK